MPQRQLIIVRDVFDEGFNFRIIPMAREFASTITGTTFMPATRFVAF
jgi:hypothetical protein